MLRDVSFKWLSFDNAASIILVGTFLYSPYAGWREAGTASAWLFTYSAAIASSGLWLAAALIPFYTKKSFAVGVSNALAAILALLAASASISYPTSSAAATRPQSHRVAVRLSNLAWVNT